MPKDVAHILGLGDSLEHYLQHKPAGITVGVNDIWRYCPVDYLVCVDAPGTFKPDRLKVIEKSRPKEFLTHVKLWEKQPGYTPIELIAATPKPETVLKQVYLSSNNSPYVAIQVAAKKGAKQIVLHGVDLTNHHALGKLLDGTITQMLTLGTALYAHGVELYVGTTDSYLSNFMPVWNG